MGSFCRRKAEGNIKDINDGYEAVVELNNLFLESEGNVTEIEWYYDGHNIKATVQHNDGTRHYEYRELREEKDIKKLLTRIYQGKPVSRNMINYYTKSIAPHRAIFKFLRKYFKSQL